MEQSVTYYIYKIFAYRLLGTITADSWETAKEKAMVAFNVSWCDIIARKSPLPEYF